MSDKFNHVNQLTHIIYDECFSGMTKEESSYLLEKVGQVTIEQDSEQIIQIIDDLVSKTKGNNLSDYLLDYVFENLVNWELLFSKILDKAK